MMVECARIVPDPYKSGSEKNFYFIIFGIPCDGARFMGPATDDTMSDGEQFFEGVEKLLEIWFINSDGHEKNADLRRIPRSQWETLLKIVRCEIISFTKNEQIDAYVLSESSMFVSKRRFILKTCGTTTPLLCLQPLLLLVQQYAGFTEVEDLFYSRKNYKRPDLQVTPHKHFDQEVALLDTLFPDGVAYCLGAVNRDCWYLYTLNPLPQRRRSTVLSASESDETLEILMTDLDPEIMAIFTKEECLNATEATKKAGIDKIIPNMTIDDFLFEPCGYSMNGVSKNGCYMTIHITPEPEFSYVSFETNVPASNYKEIIGKVLDTFMPGKFTVTVFTNQVTAVKDTSKDLLCLNQINNKWSRRDVQQISFKNYDLIYAFYTKFPS
ncbi:S-adenosylmethionine decarboxylase proenzyme isoform X2 [Anthonomus grandis grandis]|uniref:S-adenosylmethionine decarboxylase proenzyme isoform X2 n=1 Tax=Anthonomus grandis grandis TaxID=2921223 RepID=UPI0021652179|nr:S-adenosylmethionine decarboxylase proenzyme isoform X2 [Anthonomus grandis grandis]